MLVVFNAIFQLVAYSVLGYFYLTVLPGWLGLDTQGFKVGIWEVARTVLDLPRHPTDRRLFDPPDRASPTRTRLVSSSASSRGSRRSPSTGCCSRSCLLFAIQGDKITSQPLDVVLIAAPLLVYFAVMWVAGFASGRAMGFRYPQTAALAFTVASNDFELAIAVAVGVFGAASGQALAGVVGPLIEVPVLVSLVYVALWLRRQLAWPPALEPAGVLQSADASAGVPQARGVNT